MNVVLFKVSSLGDSAVFISIVQSLQERCPELKLHLCASEFAADFFKDSLPPEQMLVHDRNSFQAAWKNPVALARFWRRISKWRAEASLLGDDQGNTAYFLARLAGGRVRIGPDRTFIKIPGALTRRVPLQPKQLIPHWNWEIARVFAREVAAKELPEFPPVPAFKDCQPTPLDEREGIVVHPGASAPYQRWDIERFREVAIRLSKDHRVMWYDQVWAPHLSLPPVIERMPTVSPRALYAILARARLLLGNNSGPMHVASMAGCPAVIMNGPSNASWNPPWHPERFLVLRADIPCIACDPPEIPIGRCTNLQTPMACMKAWTAEVIHQKCLEWIERSQIGRLQAAR